MELVPAPLEVTDVSPGPEHPSQNSQGSNFIWKNLFEEEASVGRKRIREDSPQDENKNQGSEHTFYLVVRVSRLKIRYILWNQSHGSILRDRVRQRKSPFLGIWVVLIAGDE